VSYMLVIAKVSYMPELNYS